MLSKEEDELLAHAVAFLENNFPNFAIAVLSKDDELLHCDYSSWRVGRMLFRDSLEDMEKAMNFENWAMEEWEDEDDE